MTMRTSRTFSVCISACIMLFLLGIWSLLDWIFNQGVQVTSWDPRKCGLMHFLLTIVLIVINLLYLRWVRRREARERAKAAGPSNAEHDTETG